MRHDFFRIDGCCRHVVATLFEINDYQNDSEKKSCTSHACSWVRRSSQAENIGKPIPVADLDTSVLPSNGYKCKIDHYYIRFDTFLLEIYN